jgi:UDP-glucose 4-epimerase
MRRGRVRFNSDEMSKFRLERLDINLSSELNELISGFVPDVIVHLAAIHFIPECEQAPSDAIQTNVIGTVNLLLACPTHARFIFASSGAVYEPDSQPHHESKSKLAPTDIYGASKLFAEHFVRYFAAQRDFSGVVVRLFNVIGPGETNPHVMPEIIAQLKAGRTKIRLGNLWPKRDYINVKDAARGFGVIATSDQTTPGKTLTVNLGTSKQYSVEMLLDELRRIAGIEFSIESDATRVRAVDRPFLGANIDEIHRLFGWEPLHSIDDAVADLWRDPDFTSELMKEYQ